MKSDEELLELSDKEFLDYINQKMKEVSMYSVNEITRLCKLGDESAPPFMPNKIEYKGDTLKHIYKKAIAKIKE